MRHSARARQIVEIGVPIESAPNAYAAAGVARGILLEAYLGDEDGIVDYARGKITAVYAADEETIEGWHVTFTVDRLPDRDHLAAVVAHRADAAMAAEQERRRETADTPF